MARRSSGGSGGGDAERRPSSRRRSSAKKPSAKKRSASARTGAERKAAAAKRAAKRKPPEGTAPAAQTAAEASPAPARRARLVRPGELWGRRSVAIGALLVALAIVGGIVLLVTGGGGGSNSTTVSPQVKQLQDKFLKHTVVDVQKGISVRRPGDWKDSKRNHAITLTSHDRCLTMILSAPQGPSKLNTLRREAIAAVTASMGGAKAGPAPSGQQIGGIPTQSSTLVSTRKGSQTRVLLSIGKGDKYAYITEVVLGSPACHDDLRLANLVLTSVQYTK